MENGKTSYIHENKENYEELCMYSFFHIFRSSPLRACLKIKFDSTIGMGLTHLN